LSRTAQVLSRIRSASWAEPTFCQPWRDKSSSIRDESASFIWQPKVWMKKPRPALPAVAPAPSIAAK
jgi:hypothetical protein